MRESRRPRGRFVVVALVGVLSTLAVTVAVGGTSAAEDSAAAAPVRPAATCTQPSTVDGFTPQQLAARYGIDDLVASGADGRGVTIAVLGQGESVDLDLFAEWEACMGVTGSTVTQRLVGGGSMPAAGNEVQDDVAMAAGVIPGADVHVLVSNGDLASLLRAALDPANTGGRPVDILSLSFGGCETEASPSDVEATNTALAEVAAAGVWFLKSAGDSGSDECAPHGQCPPYPSAGANVEYPTSHPAVTGVGGTQIPSGETRGRGEVWKTGSPDCSGGGGGRSTLFTRPAFQDGFGPAGETARMVPDLSGLSGSPYYQILHSDGWVQDGGTSFAAPLYAAGFAAVRSYLAHEGVAAPTSLNEALYRAASDPATYRSVFADITETDNDLLGVGCCTAGPGYDMASGLGEVDFHRFAEWLVAQARTTPTSTVTTLAADEVTASDPGRVVVPSFTG